eukprot:2996305-Pleurochrysis_carterae.AAC.3
MRARCDACALSALLCAALRCVRAALRCVCYWCVWARDWVRKPTNASRADWQSGSGTGGTSAEASGTGEGE